MHDEDPALDDPALIDKPLSPAELAEAKEMDLAATEPPWWYAGGKLYWRMHGTAGWSSALGDVPAQPINWQILKVIKDSGGRFQEYWPNEADALMMTKGRGYFRRLRITLELAEAKLAAIARQHAAYKIFEACGHDHEPKSLDEGLFGLYYVRKIGLVCDEGYQHSVCRECCIVDDEPSRHCQLFHDHAEYLCPTDAILKGELD